MGELIMNGRGCKAKLRKITQIYPRSPKFRQNKAKLVTIVGGKKRHVGESDNEWERMRGKITQNYPNLPKITQI